MPLALITRKGRFRAGDRSDPIRGLRNAGATSPLTNPRSKMSGLKNAVGPRAAPDQDAAAGRQQFEQLPACHTAPQRRIPEKAYSGTFLTIRVLYLLAVRHSRTVPRRSLFPRRRIGAVLTGALSAGINGMARALWAKVDEGT